MAETFISTGGTTTSNPGTEETTENARTETSDPTKETTTNRNETISSASRGKNLKDITFKRFQHIKTNKIW